MRHTINNMFAITYDSATEKGTTITNKKNFCASTMRILFFAPLPLHALLYGAFVVCVCMRLCVCLFVCVCMRLYAFVCVCKIYISATQYYYVLHSVYFRVKIRV